MGILWPFPLIFTLTQHFASLLDSAAAADAKPDVVSGIITCYSAAHTLTIPRPPESLTNSQWTAFLEALQRGMQIRMRRSDPPIECLQGKFLKDLPEDMILALIQIMPSVR